MRIKIAPRATITDEFIELAIWLARKRMEVVQLYMASKIYQWEISNLPDIALNKREAGRGIDLMLTRLKRLPFTSFWRHDTTAKVYMAGKTNPITLAGRCVGPYTIYIPTTAFLTGSFREVHLIPEAEPTAYARHPHHGAYSTPASNETVDPLDMTPSWCASQFAEVMNGFLKRCDVVEAFRWLHEFTSSYNPRSPLYSSAIITQSEAWERKNHENPL